MNAFACFRPPRWETCINGSGDARSLRGADSMSARDCLVGVPHGLSVESINGAVYPDSTTPTACARVPTSVCSDERGRPRAHLDAHTAEEGCTARADASPSAERRGGQPAPDLQPRELILRVDPSQGGGCKAEPTGGAPTEGHEAGDALAGARPDDGVQLLPGAARQAAGAARAAGRCLVNPCKGKDFSDVLTIAIPPIDVWH